MTLWPNIIQRFSRAGPRGRGREWATLGVHPLSWVLSNNRLEEVCGTLTKGTFSSRLLQSNQDKGCTPSVAHSLPLPLPPSFCSTCLIYQCAIGSEMPSKIVQNLNDNTNFAPQTLMKEIMLSPTWQSQILTLSQLHWKKYPQFWILSNVSYCFVYKIW